MPVHEDGSEEIYLAGNSLGLAPIAAGEMVNAELEIWSDRGVRGHFGGPTAWMPYHELVGPSMARLVGGLDAEVVAMNSLTVNLHLMLAAFYQPVGARRRVLIEEHAFPSDHFAAESHLEQRGQDPSETLVTVGPEPGSELLDLDIIEAKIRSEGEQLALVLLPGVHYFTGQVLDMERLVTAAHEVGAVIGFDLAHAVGNVALELHRWGADFAVWCTYKYLNAGPGSVGGCFVHERHLGAAAPPHFKGWWGTDPATRFKMENDFEPRPTAEAWQLSNAPIFSMAALRASLDVFDTLGTTPVQGPPAQAGSGGSGPLGAGPEGAPVGPMGRLSAKSRAMAEHFDRLLADGLGGRVETITPLEPSRRGAQRSLRITPDGPKGGWEVFQIVEDSGVACDWRHPDVIRVAPVPLYNRFADIDEFVARLRAALDS